MTQAAEGYITVEIVVAKEGDQFSSWCPNLDIASCGDTFEEAVDNLRDAMEVYLDTLKEEGELKSVLQARGIRVEDAEESTAPSLFVAQYRQKVSVSV